jgi:hypothetical protein
MVWELFAKIIGMFYDLDRRLLIKRMKNSEDPDLWWKYRLSSPPRNRMIQRRA